MKILGNILDPKYRIEVERARIAEISKMFNTRDIYGVEIELDQDNASIL